MGLQSFGSLTRLQQLHLRVDQGILSAGLEGIVVGGQVSVSASAAQGQPQGQQVLSFDQENCLFFSLGSGPEELAGLGQVEVLNVGGMGHRIGEQERKWMKKHWPRLKAIRGL